LVEVLEQPHWLDDEKLKPVKALFRNRFYARQQIDGAVRQIMSEELSKRLDASGIVYSMIAKNAEVIDDEQLIANGVIVASQSGVPGVERTFATPIQLSSEGQRTPQRAPNVGEHTQEILQELGLQDAEITQLQAAGVIKIG
jgi:crotonobetainyl-CoA:carnitine CoA-transferase CaiB-like acyl-CoA transferase